MNSRIDIGSEFGLFLIGRGIGAEIRKRHFSGVPSTWPRVVDFSNVKQATESCLDELFGTLAREHGKQSLDVISVEGASKTVKETYQFVRSLIDSPPPAISAEAIDRLLSSKKKRHRRTSK